MRIYSDYFGIRENAFAITPDPRYLFLSERHREAMAHLLFGTEEGGGFVQLTGEVGTGKTTICRAFLEQLPESVDVALLLSPPDNARELLLAIAAELQLRVPRRVTPTGELVALLNQRLLATHAAGRRTVVIIDEAQNILPEVLEQVRLLTNLETATHKLLQVFLIGQPELRQKLQHPALRQVAQRVTARYHLEPLSLSETQGYIQHRLAVAGCGQRLFSGAAFRQIYRHSQGIPRVINILCDRALIGAYATESLSVKATIVRHAAREWRGEEGGARRGFALPAAAMVAGLLVLTLAGLAVNGNVSSVEDMTDMVSTGITGDWFTRSDLLPTVPGPDPHNAVAGGDSATASPVSSGRPLSATIPAQPRLGSLSGRVPAIVAAREESPGKETPATGEFLSADHVVQRGIPVALHALSDRWGIDGNAVDRLSLCRRANRHGLSCMEDFGRWDELRGYNRPALLTLHRQHGNEAYLALVGLDRKRALVATAEGVFPVALRELEAYWTGEFMLLWRPPLGRVSMIAAGANEQAVQWLQGALQRGDGVVTSAREFDRDLQQRLRAFQHSRGLAADGIAGPRTLIHLNNLLEQPQVPLLVATNRND